jgi:TetR/AcrR family tetracycline transcriptional repressor
MKLERQRIIDAAIAVLDEVGIDDLTTRKLADRLGVQQPALYWHFRNKRALLDAMNADMLHRHHTHDHAEPGEDWREFVVENARSFRRALLSHRDGARVHAGTEAVVEDLEKIQSQLACLVDAGFATELAIHGLMTVSRFVLGSVLDQQADEQNNDDWARQGLDEAAKALPLVSDALAIYRQSGHDASFETGLSLIADGLALHVAHPGAPGD